MASRTSSSARSEKNTRTAPPRRKPSPTPSPARRNVSRPPSIDEDEAPGRVRVSVRLRPKNAEELASHADFADFVELQPELKRLVLRKNNWTSESYKFDDVFPEAASQKRVYDAVAKPVVESVLNGYNGTVMAYGQTGSGKTYTLGRLGKLDPSEGGIMVRALDHILSNTSASSDMVAISYLQLYMETLQDLLSPEKSNISIIEDPKIGEVSLPGSTIVKIRDIDHAMQLLEIGERNRCTANTKFNTESSRSHAILVVFVQRTVKEKSESENSPKRDDDVPIILRSKLLIVDLAGSERIDKSGGEGHTLEEAKSINLSLTSLGKCINAIAENSPHIPTRDSKLTRLLRDSFGGSARTSLIVTIGPSGRYIGETTSTLMFGQRAMKIENVVKLREEFDYEALCRKLELRLDYLTAENERGKKSRDVEKKEMENKLKEYELRLTETQKNLVVISESSMQEKHFLEEQFNHVLSDLNIQRERHHLMCEELESLQLSLRQIRVEMQLEMQKHANEPSILCDPQIDCLTLQNGFVREEQLGTGNVEVQDKKLIDLVRLEISACQKVLAGTTQFYQVKFSDLVQQLEDERTNSNSLQKELLSMKRSTDQESSRKIQEQTELEEMRKKLKELHMLHENALQEMQKLRVENEGLLSSRANLSEEKEILQKKLSDAVLEKNCFEDELLKLKNAMLTTSSTYERMKSHGKENAGKVAWGVENLSGKFKPYQSRDTIFVQRATMAKIFEEVGLQKILALLQSDDLDVQVHAVKVVANLAAEDANQEKIVNEGGLDALLLLLDSSQNETIRRVASGAIANLAMNENNQSLIMNKGGGRLLSNMASKTEDSQTQRMIAGAIANLCGNEKLHVKLKADGGIKGLLEMAKSGHSDVIAQVARGFANFAKCESRGGYKNGQSLLIEDGALTWMMANSSCNSASTRRHVELAFCHLAQHEENAKSIISSGALRELIHIASDSARDDIRSLAKKVINTSPALRAEIQKHKSTYA